MTDHMPVKAVHAVSLFEALGDYIAPNSVPTGYTLPRPRRGGVDVLALPAELARRGFGAVQLSHFFLPSTAPSFLGELRAAFTESGVELECFLVDDGDLTDPEHHAFYREWISSYVAVGALLGAGRVRVVAGMQPPTPETLALSARHLRELAHRHPEVRVLTENWNALLVDDAAVHQVLDQAEGDVGFLVDLGNWTGPDKQRMLDSVAPRAESCQAKVQTSATGDIDREDFEQSLRTLLRHGYTGPLALVHRGPGDQWAKLDEAYGIAVHVTEQRSGR